MQLSKTILQPFQAHRDVSGHTETARSVDVGSISIAYETFGNPENPTVLLIMGMGAQMLVWPETLCKLIADQGFYVIRFDNRDIGLSSKFTNHSPRLLSGFCFSLLGLPVCAPYTLWDMAADCDQLLTKLMRPEAHVVGASMGGMIGQIFAKQFAHRTSSLSIMMSDSGYSGIPCKNLKLIKALLRKPPTTGSSEDLIHYKASIIQAIGSRSYPSCTKEIHLYLRKVLARCDDDSLGTLRQCAALMATGSLHQLQPLIKTKTLVIHGDEDPLIPYRKGIKIAQRIRNASFELVSGMGHDFPKPLIARFGKSLTEHFLKNC